MKQKPYKEAEIEKGLESLDGVQRAAPQPFFFTRVYARLHRTEQTIWDKVSSFMTRPVVAIAGIILIISINATVVMWKAPETTPSYAEQDEQTIPEEYDLAVNTIYDYVNPEQK